LADWQWEYDPDETRVTIEMASTDTDLSAALIPVRDSKAQDGPVLLIAANAWTTFVASVPLLGQGT